MKFLFIQRHKHQNMQAILITALKLAESSLIFIIYHSIELNLWQLTFRIFFYFTVFFLIMEGESDDEDSLKKQRDQESKTRQGEIEHHVRGLSSSLQSYTFIIFWGSLFRAVIFQPSYCTGSNIIVRFNSQTPLFCNCYLQSLPKMRVRLF